MANQQRLSNDKRIIGKSSEIIDPLQLNISKKRSNFNIKFEINENLCPTENLASNRSSNPQTLHKFLKIINLYPFMRKAIGDHSIIYLLVGGLVIETYLTSSKDAEFVSIVDACFEIHINHQKHNLEKRIINEDLKESMLSAYNQLFEKKKKGLSSAIKLLYEMLNPTINEAFCKSLITFIRLRIIQYMCKSSSKAFPTFINKLEEDPYRVDPSYLSYFLFSFAEAFSFEIHYKRINTEKLEEDINYRSSSGIQFIGTIFEFTSKSESCKGILYNQTNHAYLAEEEILKVKSQSFSKSKAEDSIFNIKDIPPVQSQISNFESQTYKNEFSTNLNEEINLKRPKDDSNTILVKRISNDYLKCDVDNGEYQKELIFINKCKHQYCVYCIEENENFQLLENATYYCPLIICKSNIDKDKLKKFKENGKNSEKPKENHKEIAASIHSLIPFSQNNPQLNEKELSELLQCSKCMKKYLKTRCFINNKCNHIYCVDCLQQNPKAFEIVCPLRTCLVTIDKNSIADFLQKLMINDQKIQVICKLCHEVNYVTRSKVANLKYLKCSHCSKIICYIHNDVMEKCLCLCPQCTSSFVSKPCLSEKICMKCKTQICFDCGELSQDLLKICDCKCELCYKMKEKDNISQKLCNSCLHNANICFGCHEEGELNVLFKLKCNHQLCQRCIFDSVIKKLQINKKNESLSLDKLCPKCIKL